MGRCQGLCATRGAAPQQGREGLGGDSLSFSQGCQGFMVVSLGTAGSTEPEKESSLQGGTCPRALQGDGFRGREKMAGPR